MPTVSEMINEIPMSKLVNYICSKTKKMSESDCVNIITSIRGLTPVNDSDMAIADMISIDESAVGECPSYINEVMAYTRDGDNLEFYDISNANWNIIAGMEICESSLLNLLPHEIIGDIILIMTSYNQTSPSMEDSNLTLITEDNYVVSRELIYKIFNVVDDRTSEEKDYDKYAKNYTYNHMRESFGKYIMSTAS